MVREGLITIAAAALVLTYGLSHRGHVAAQTPSDDIRELLWSRVEEAGLPAKCAVAEEILCASLVLPLFYERRTYEPAWVATDGVLPRVNPLIKAIREADREGLTPDDYHLAAIERTIEKVRQDQEQGKQPNPLELVDLELLLTDAFLLYSSHLLSGKVDPESLHAGWIANPREADLAEVLERALNSDQTEETLMALLPPHPGYARLREALQHYRIIAANGGWPTVPDGPSMRGGDHGERVATLRASLIAQGYLFQEGVVEEELFDPALDQAVRRFQELHGLEVDGVVGPKTIASLNLPVEERIRQIELNMERWRWLPQALGERYVLVNIVNFELSVVEKGERVMSMRVVVGLPYRRTPVFSDNIAYMVLNPYWEVPRSIAVRDKLPLIRERPDYLTENNFKVLQGWGADTKEIDPRTVDWSLVNARSFPYRLRQDPGPKNALGRIKFMFPNRFNVYLHDTPSQELFADTSRTFSSGCIRIEKPIDLAEYLMRGHPQWSREKILATIAEGKRQTIPLPHPIPLHLLYWTAWADENGTIHHRRDVYQRDKVVDEALRERPPIPE